MNTNKVRTALFLYAWQLEKLRHMSARTGAPVSELIRRAIAIYLQETEERANAK